MALALSITFGNFVAGYSSNFSGPAGYELQSPNATDIFGNNITLSLQQVSWFTSVQPLGILCGSVFGGHVAERIGRKRNSISLGIGFFIGNLIIALSISSWMIIIGRIVIGIACGLQFSTSMVYLIEATSTDFRNGVISYVTIWQNLGTIFMFALSIVLDWKYLALMGAIWALIFIATVSAFAIESPVWLLKKGRIEECESALKWLCGDESARTEEIITKKLKPLLKKDGPSLKCKDLSENRNSVIIAFILSLAYFVLCYRQIMAYLNTVLHFLNLESDFLGPATLIITLGQTVGSIFSVYFSKRFDRKPILVASSLGLTLCLALLSSL